MIGSELDQLAPAWDELAVRVDATPFLRPGWVRAWWRAFGRGRLDVVAVHRAGRLVGLVPFVRRRGAVLSPTNWHTPEFGLLAEDEAARRELAEALADLRPARLDLSFLTLDSGLDDLVQAVRQRGRVSIVRALQRSPYVEVRGAFDDYLEEGRARKLSDLRRLRRRLEEGGQLEVSFEADYDRLEELLADVFRIEASGWKGRRGVAIASDPKVAAFYTEVAEWAAEQRMLHLGFLHLDGSPIAAIFNLESGGVLWGLKSGYDERYRRFSPGTILLSEALRYCFEKRLRRFDLMGESDPHKLVWATGVREKIRLQAFSRGPAGLAQYGGYGIGRPLVKRTVALIRGASSRT